jgi:CBS domain-containing protein
LALPVSTPQNEESAARDSGVCDTPKLKETNMKCRDVMTENPICCLPEDSVGQAARVMRRERVGSVPVVIDELKKELIGVITDRDLAYKVVGESRDAIRTRVYDVMTAAVAACRDDDDVITALLAMEEHQVRCIPVMDHSGRLVGMISESDVAVRVPPTMQLVRDLGQAA